jgi:hypothetical protein
MRVSDLQFSATFHLGLDAVINLIPDEAGNETPQFLIFHKLDGLIAVAIHAVHHDFFELRVENISEVVKWIRFARVPDGLIGGSVGADLLPEELVGSSEISSKALVQHIDNA